MCACACVRSEALAALAPVAPRTKQDFGVRSESEVCKILRRTLVRCGCEPVSLVLCAHVCMCASLWTLAPEVVGSITHHLCVSVKSLKSQCLQRFRGIFLAQLPGTLCQKVILLCQR